MLHFYLTNPENKVVINIARLCIVVSFSVFAFAIILCNVKSSSNNERYQYLNFQDAQIVFN